MTVQRLVEQLGYKAADVSGAGLSKCNLGWADNVEDTLGSIRTISEDSPLPG